MKVRWCSVELLKTLSALQSSTFLVSRLIGHPPSQKPSAWMWRGGALIACRLISYRVLGTLPAPASRHVLAVPRYEPADAHKHKSRAPSSRHSRRPRRSISSLLAPSNAWQPPLDLTSLYSSLRINPFLVDVSLHCTHLYRQHARHDPITRRRPKTNSPCRKTTTVSRRLAHHPRARENSRRVPSPTLGQSGATNRTFK